MGEGLAGHRQGGARPYDPFLMAVSIFGFDIFLALVGVGVMLAIKGLLIINKKMNNQLR
jgi:hypothetical protein